MRLLLAALLIAGGAAAPTFDEFVQRYGKVYSSDAQRTLRARVFDANMQLFEASNAMGSSSYSLGMNQFSDLTMAEFRETYLMHCGSHTPAVFPGAPVEAEPAFNVSALPSSFDWVSQGAVTPVKDQGSVGTCWAFSTTGNVEGQVFLATKQLISLSEEYLVDCDDTDCSVFGGWPHLAAQYIISSGGIPTEASYPYCCGTGDCYPCMLNKNVSFCGPPPEYCNKTQNAQCKTASFAAKLKSWTQLPKNEDQLAALLVSGGPISVLMDASYLQYYTSGIWDPSGLFDCDSSGSLDSLDHAVLIVGYGVNGTTPYWKVKNSWNQSWGEDGYFRIIRGVGKCGINSNAITTTVA